ncbi:MAG: HTH domain-containing protein, partial [Bacillota bacterium]
RGYFYEPQAWPNDDISYGFIEVVQKYEDSTIPVVVKVFASHPNYLVWMVNLGVVLDKYLKLSDGNPPPNIPVWTLIPDEGYNQYLVELWSKGYSTTVICSKLDVSERTIYNRISELRKKYGEIIVPLRNKPKNTKKR